MNALQKKMEAQRVKVIKAVDAAEAAAAGKSLTDPVVVFDPAYGRFLVSARYPACWTPHRDMATQYERDHITKLTRTWPYLNGCEIIPLEEA